MLRMRGSGCLCGTVVREAVMHTVSIEGLLLEGETQEVALDGGRYTVVGRLGSGGMAQVYRAWDNRLGVWRAVKLLSARRTEREWALKRFEREARIMARLDHPDLVRVYDFDFHQGRPYIVMEMVSGGSLWDWMERHQSPLPVRDAVKACSSICAGLAAAHERGVIHRDVKPNNVLITAEGRFKLTDFGVALLEGHGRENRGARLGTEGFLSPEQSTDPGRVDPRADLYGVGATLFMMVTGRRPRSLHDAHRDPSLLRRLPRVLRPLVRRATAYLPEDRPPDALAMLGELQALGLELPGRPDETPPLFERQVVLPGIGGVPTGPTMLARSRSHKAQADTVPLPSVRIGPLQFEGEEPTLSGGWPSEPEMAAGTAGFMVGASVIGVVAAVIILAAALLI